MKTLICFLMMRVGAAAAEPQAPRTVFLDPSVITDVTLNDKVTTMLVFPEEVTLVAGAGLSDGSVAGIVQVDHPKGARTVALKSMGQPGRTLVQIMTGGEVYAMRLSPGDGPDSVVHFDTPPPQGAAEIVKTPLISAPGEIDAVLLSACRKFVKEAEPFGALPLEMRMASYAKTSDAAEITVEKIARSNLSDIIVISGHIRNLSDEPLKVSLEDVCLLVGGSRQVLPCKFQMSDESIPKGGQVTFFLVVAGDGRGFRANLSIKNRFEVLLEKPGKTIGDDASNNESVERS